MYILLAIFFLSLVGIMIMIGRKLALLRRGEGMKGDAIALDMPLCQDIKIIIVKGARKYGYIALVFIIRYYVKTENYLKLKLTELKTRAGEMRKKNGNGEPGEGQIETNAFLQRVSEYKHKIRKIKHRIHEEEKSL